MLLKDLQSNTATVLVIKMSIFENMKKVLVQQNSNQSNQHSHNRQRIEWTKLINEIVANVTDTESARDFYHSGINRYIDNVFSIPKYLDARLVLYQHPVYEICNGLHVNDRISSESVNKLLNQLPKRYMYVSIHASPLMNFDFLQNLDKSINSIKLSFDNTKDSFEFLSKIDTSEISLIDLSEQKNVDDDFIIKLKKKFNLDQVRFLNLKNSDVTHASLFHLANEWQIDSLNLDSTMINLSENLSRDLSLKLESFSFYNRERRLCDVAVSRIIRMIERNKLETLRLRFTNAGEETSKEISQNQIQIKSLNMSSTDIMTDDVVLLLNHCNRLFDLDISCNYSFNHERIDFSNISNLSLRDNLIDDKKMLELKNLGSLKTINLSQNEITQNSARFLLKNNKNLKQVNLSQNKITNIDLGEILNSSSIESLNLSDCGLLSIEGDKREGERRYYKLNRLKISGNRIDKASLETVVFYSNLCSFHYLDFSYNHLKESRWTDGLKVEGTLDISGNMFESKDIYQIIKNTCFLRYIDILAYDLEISDDIYDILGYKVAKKSLRRINMDHLGTEINKVRDKIDPNFEKYYHEDNESISLIMTEAYNDFIL
tara:strand:- start:228 stop:2033 length:1806 start_codon:yes stop_codon:yes gene_type:complete